jgi:hypothetical protein
MGIDYRFGEWRNNGEIADAWSPMAYRLLSKNIGSEQVNGFRIGHILYLHHIQGMEAKEIKQTSVGYGIATNMIKSILKGFRSKNGGAGRESIEAYEIVMGMIQNEKERTILEKMYQINVSNL